jgi:hypothetical protein
VEEGERGGGRGETERKRKGQIEVENVRLRETLVDVKIKKEGERDSKDMKKHNERDMTEREVM